MNIIFLDIDGVLQPYNNQYRFNYFEPVQYAKKSSKVLLNVLKNQINDVNIYLNNLYPLYKDIYLKELYPSSILSISYFFILSLR